MTFNQKNGTSSIHTLNFIGTIWLQIIAKTKYNLLYIYKGFRMVATLGRTALQCNVYTVFCRGSSTAIR